MKSKSKMKHAISLIVLVVTILVLSILVAAVIISLTNSNIMAQASNTVFKQDMANFKEAYEMYVIGVLADNPDYDRSTFNLTYETDAKLFKEIFGENITDKYKKGLKVVNGKLVYETEDEVEKDILEDLGMVSTVTPQLSASVKEMVDGVPIPVEFYYVGGDKATGVVISDDAKDEDRGIGENDICVGNQFVWVPVDYTKAEGEEATAYEYTYTKDDGTTEDRTAYLYDSFTEVFRRGKAKVFSTTEDGIEIYKMTDYSSFDSSSSLNKEPYESGYTNEIAEYYEMMESVQKYGGFYIARFEAGDGDATASDEERTTVTEAHTVVSKRYAYVYNHVPWGLSTTETKPVAGKYDYYDKDSGEYIYQETNTVVAGAVYLSKNMYKDYESVVSTLCYGVQWDAMMNFVSDEDHNIKNSSSWGNHKVDSETAINELRKTGSNEAWKAKNIYDLAGNAWEWTMENSGTTRRVERGGYYKAKPNTIPASARGSIEPYSAWAGISFRPSLYIK